LHYAHYFALSDNFDQLCASFARFYGILADSFPKPANTNVYLACYIYRILNAFSTTLDGVCAFFSDFCKTPANPHYDPAWRVIGKVQYCKLAVIHSCGCIVRLGRIDLIVEHPQVDLPPVCPDSSPPFIRPRFLAYAPVTRWRLAAFASIAAILRRCGRPEVWFAIIEAVVIYVIANEAFGNVDDLVVHQYSLSFFAAAGARIAIRVERVPVGA
jgi:hypothetical protein